jgi:mannose-6-phosphate isomerase-like protein (cupin superfamily)
MTEVKPQGKIDKGWGYELVWASNDLYCAKILVFTKVGSKCSLHFHKHRDKTWFINSGKFLLRWIDVKDAKAYQKELVEGETWHVPPMQPHQIESLTSHSSLTEVSTAQDANDLYRISVGDSQSTSVEK